MRLPLNPHQDLPEEGKGKCIKAPNGSSIALFKVEGKYYAINNRCPHQGGPLCEGELEGDRVTCPWHGWQFNVKTGSCENQLGDEVETYQVMEEEGHYYLLISCPSETSN